MISTPLKQLSLLALSLLTATLFTACSSDNGQGKQNSKHGLINTPPVAKEANLNLKEDTMLSITLQATDADKDTLGYRVSQQPTHGTLKGKAPKLTYTPNKDYNGADSFTFIANDGQADSTPATVKLAIIPVNDAPVAKDDAISLDEDTNITIEPLTNDTDVDGDTLSIKSFTQPKHGTLTQKENTLVYAPNKDYNGEDSFGYTLTDGNATAKANITLTITPVNDAPIAQEGSQTLNEDTPTPIVFPAHDVDGDALQFAIHDNPKHGSLREQGGQWVYTPNKDYNGQDLFTYTATDGKANSNEARFHLTILPVADVISLTPSASLVTLAEHNRTQITLKADYEDGTTKDVTAKASYASSDSAVDVDKGEIIANTEGEADITIRYQGKKTHVHVDVHEMIDGHLLPHAPKNPDATLLGVDANHNGVRDDVERWIYKEMPTYHHAEIERVVAMTEAKAYQKALADPTNKGDNVVKAMDRALNCWAYYADSRNIPYDEDVLKFDNRLRDAVFNTKERLQTYLQYDSTLGGRVFTLTALRLLNTSYCDQNIDILP